LIEWVSKEGGFVDDRLKCVQQTPQSLCRGVLAVHSISEEELREGAPLIAVPEKCYLTSDHARQLLRSLKGGASSNTVHVPSMAWVSASAGIGLPLTTGLSGPSSSQQEPSTAFQVALLLAHERSVKGPASFWWPYIDSLPARPPNPWLMPDAELEAALAAVGPAAQEQWPKEVERARHAIHQQAEAAVRQYGKALGVDEQGVVWAAAQVLSRAFGSDTELGMAPLIDMCNHRAGADTPWGSEDVDGQPVSCITSCHNGQPSELLAGDELFISYMARCSPLEAFLNFGFVPPELMSKVK